MALANNHTKAPMAVMSQHTCFGGTDEARAFQIARYKGTLAQPTKGAAGGTVYRCSFCGTVDPNAKPLD